MIDPCCLLQLEKAMATHSSTLAWKIPWAEEPGRLQSMGSRRVRHWATSFSCIGEGNGNPLLCSCLENPRDGGAWWAAVYGITQNQTWLKRLSSSSNSKDIWRRASFICLFIIITHTCICSREVSVQGFCSYVNQVDHFLIVEFYGFFVYFW